MFAFGNVGLEEVTAALQQPVAATPASPPEHAGALPTTTATVESAQVAQPVSTPSAAASPQPLRPLPPKPPTKSIGDVLAALPPVDATLIRLAGVEVQPRGLINPGNACYINT